MFIEAALRSIQQSGQHPERIDRLAQDIPAHWIEQALEQTGVATLRKRRLPAEQVVWLVIGMALMRNRSILDVVSKLDLAFSNKKGLQVAASSIAQARERVGTKPLQWLFSHTAKVFSEHAQSSALHLKDLRVFAMDGSLFHAWDSKENRVHFGLASGNTYPGSGYPLVRLCTLTDVETHLVRAARMGGYTDSEHTLLKELMQDLPDSSLSILDKNFHGTPFLWALMQSGHNRHFLLPAKKNAVSVLKENLGRNDYLIELSPSSDSLKKYPDMPKTLTVRALRYRHPKTGKYAWLLTSLTDPKKYPKAALVALYKKRWEIEISYDEIKTDMLARKETLRSKTPQGVKQELWGLLLAYNLVRLQIWRLAIKAKLSTLRFSFIAALRLIQDEWLWCSIASPGSIPQKLVDLENNIMHFILPKRKKRSYPRALKFISSKYPKKQPNSNIRELK